MKIPSTWAAITIVASFTIPSAQCDTFKKCTSAADWFKHGECIDIKYGILEKAITRISQEVSTMQRVLEALRVPQAEHFPQPSHSTVKSEYRDSSRLPRSTRPTATPNDDATSSSTCVCTTTDPTLPTPGSPVEITPVVVDNIFEELAISYNNRDVLLVSVPEVISAAQNGSDELVEPLQLQVKDNLQPFALPELVIQLTKKTTEPAKLNDSSSDNSKAADRLQVVNILQHESITPTVERHGEPGPPGPDPTASGDKFNQQEVARRFDELEKNNAAKFEDLEKQLQVLREELATAIKVVMADAEEKKKMFFDGAKQGKVTAVRTLLTAGLKPQETDSSDKGRTALHKAVKEGHKEVAKMLLATNASVNARDFNSWTPLHFAVSQGHADLVQLLLDAGASSLARVDDRSTPLHLAAQRGSKEVMEVLLKTNASVHAKDINGNTPLHLTARNNHPKVAELLVKAGASKLIKNNLHETAKEVALSKGFTNLAEIL